MTTLLEVLLSLVALPLSLANAYLLSLTLLSRRLPTVASKAAPSAALRGRGSGARRSKRGLAPRCATCSRSTTRKSSSSSRWSPTIAPMRPAARAAEAGGRVLVRNDQEKRGKGYALAHAFELLAPDVDAVVVVDADTVVSPNLLRAFEARIQAGALAVQADYAVRNPGVAWLRVSWPSRSVRSTC